MPDNYHKPTTLITFGLPSTDVDFLAELQEFIDSEAERRQRIAPEWLSIRIDGVKRCVIEAESGCRLDFEGGTSKVEIVGRDAAGEVVIATYLPTYDGPKTEAWKVSLPSGDEVSCIFEYDDEECVRVEAKRIANAKLGGKHAQPVGAPLQEFAGFSRDRDLLRPVSVEERDKGSVRREFGVDRRYLRVLLDRAKGKFRSLYASFTSPSRPLTLFDPSRGRSEPGPRLTGAPQMPPRDIDPLRVFLVAESAPLRESLCGVFRSAGISVVGQRRDCDLTAKEIARTRCDVLLVNPGTTVNHKVKTMELLREILNFTPRMRVIVFGMMMEDPACFLEAVGSGVLGFLLPDASAAEIISAVRSIKRGGIVCPERFRLILLQHFSQRCFPGSRLSLEADARGLTDRQRDLFGSCRPTADK
jgi:DNA-binding NarL/FixJ family response regulator